MYLHCIVACLFCLSTCKLKTVFEKLILWSHYFSLETNFCGLLKIQQSIFHMVLLLKNV